MNDPQVWTLISVFSAALSAMLGVVSGLFTHVVRAEVARVEGRIEGWFDGIGGRFDGINGRFDGVNARIDGLDQRMDSLRYEVNGVSTG